MYSESRVILIGDQGLNRIGLYSVYLLIGGQNATVAGAFPGNLTVLAGPPSIISKLSRE